MAPDPTKHGSTSLDQKTLDHEIRDLISVLTTRLTTFQRAHNKPGTGSSNNDPAGLEDDEQGVRIITLAGNNVGATMRGDVDNKPSAVAPNGLSGPDEADDLATYVNSNFQAINNSIMMGGSYRTNDPGVHLEISDSYDHDDEAANKLRGKRGRKNARQSSKSGHRNHREQSERLDETSDSS